MKKKYNNLNEEINRIKQLFGNETGVIITESDDKLLGYIQKVENLQRELDKITSSDERKKQIDLINKTLNITKEYIKSNNITVDPTLKLKLTNMEKVSSEITGLMNEEVDRIKSLFTEERLYGNLVDKTAKLITEQKWSKLIDDILKGIAKGKKSVVFKAPLGDSRGALSIKKVGDDIEWYRAGKKIDPTIENFLSIVSKKEIDDILYSVNNKNDLSNFLKSTDGGYNKIQDIIVKDMRAQGLLDESQATKLLNTMKQANVGEDLYENLFRNKEFLDGLYSMSDIRRSYPEMMEYVDDIPGLERTLKRQLLKEKDVFYEDDIVDIIRKIQKDKLKVSQPFENNPYTYVIEIPDGKLRKELIEISKNSDTIHYMKTNDTIVIRTDRLDSKTQNFIDSTIKVKPEDSIIRSKATIGNRSVQADVDEQTQNIIKNMQNSTIRSRRGVYTNKETLTNLKVFGKKLLQKTHITTGWDYIKEAFMKDFRKKFNWNKWKKSGAGKGKYIDTELQLNEVEINFVEDFLEVPSRKGGSKLPWVDAELDADLIKKGYPEGSIHPNAKLKKNFRQDLYKGIDFRGKRYWNSIFVKSGYRDYNSFLKAFGRFMKKSVLFWPYGEGVIFTEVFGEIFNFFFKHLSRGVINDILGGDKFPNIIRLSYTNTCLTNVKENIQGSDKLSDEAKKKLLGSTEILSQSDNSSTETKYSGGQLEVVFRKVGKVDIKGAVIGKAPMYYVEDLDDIPQNFVPGVKDVGGIEDDRFWDVISKDERSITPSELKYEIDGTVGVAGDSWVVKKDDKSVYLEVNVDGDGNLCNKKSNCTKIPFSLMCEPFEDYFERNKNRDYRKVIEDITWATYWDIQMADGEKTLATITQIMKDATEASLESLDVDDSGSIDLDDVKAAQEKIVDKASGGTGSGSGQESDDDM
jgi:hypothetical protein